MFHGVRSRLIALALSTTVSAVWGEEPARTTYDAEPASSGVNLPMRTFGGTQFWGDEWVLGQWRIQRNVVTGHFRLLDDRDVRRAWGTYEACAARLAELQREAGLEAAKGKVVVLLHGLGRSRDFMRHFATSLRDEGGYDIVNVSYPSSRADIASHAQQLARVISHLDEAEEINFVAHSLGNLVVRHYLYDESIAAKAAGRPFDPRIKRFVMVGPPNHGAALARLFDNVPLYDAVLRGVGEDLARFDKLHAKLGSPPCEFAILAGGRGDESGWNPWLEGDDDLLVRVAETPLAGARDFRLLNVRHAHLGSEAEPLALARHFLQHGSFTTDAERQPIVAPPLKGAAP